MSNKADPTRAILYSVAGGVLTAVFGVLGATDAHAEPRDTAGQPPAKDPNPKKAESPAGRLTGPTPERARQQAADVRKARESRPAENKKTTKVVKTPTVVRKVGRSSDEGKKAESPAGRLTGPTPERARQQAADVRKARESRPGGEKNKKDSGRGAGGGARELIKDLTSGGSRPEPTERFPLDLSRRDAARSGSDDKKKETIEERVRRTSPSPERSRQQSADARQAKKERSQARKTTGGSRELLQDLTSAGSRPEPTDRFPLDLSRSEKKETLEERVRRTSPSPQRSRQQSADARQAKKEKAKGGAGEIPSPARLPDHLRDVLTGEPKSASGDRFPGMVPNAVVTDRGRSDGRSTGTRSGVRENLDDLLTAGPTRGRSDEFPGMASRTPSRPRPAQPPAAAKDPDDHWVGNVADEARETIVEGLEAIPAAIGSFVQANQDATTWSEADPDSEEWRAADKRIKERGEAVAEVVRNPGKVVDEVIRPYREDWNSDKPERVIGRAAVDIGTMFIPGVGVGKRVLNAAEALPGGRGPDLGAGTRQPSDRDPGNGPTPETSSPGVTPSRPDSVPGTPNQQNPPDRGDSARSAAGDSADGHSSKAGAAAPGTTSRSPNNGDRRGSRVLPNPVTQLPTLPRADHGDPPARRAAGESQRDTGTNTSQEARDRADAAPQCPTNSFVPGTLVLMADGSRKRIENIKAGDLVSARNPETGASGARPVAALITGSGQKELVEITVDTDGMAGDRTGVVVATDEHPFWVESQRRWVEAEDLAPGLLVRTPEGRALAITATRSSTVRQTVHNLSITDINTYYVFAGDAPVLVHNANGPCRVTSLINQDPLLVKAAESAGRNQRIQKEMDDLIWQFREGNTNPGLGNKALEGTGIQYLRGRNGGRVFFRNTDEGMQIVGKADKTNESRVIKRLKELYGG